MNEYLVIILFMVTPPNRSYHADNKCSGYEVKYAPAIGGCTQWDSIADQLAYDAKVILFKQLFHPSSKPK